MNVKIGSRHSDKFPLYRARKFRANNTNHARSRWELIICCCECDRGYHGYCLTGSSPSYQATSFPDDWVCEICRQQDACLASQQPSAIH
ncbi:hypothetical protein ACTXT7_004596 [Hymenolepis weldensis]